MVVKNFLYGLLAECQRKPCGQKPLALTLRLMNGFRVYKAIFLTIAGNVDQMDRASVRSERERRRRNVATVCQVQRFMSKHIAGGDGTRNCSVSSALVIVRSLVLHKRQLGTDLLRL